MGTVATITIGADSYSAYGLTSDPVADAKSYFKARLGTTSWDSADTSTKKSALISATRMIDRRPLYSGAKTVSAQDLEWPRDGATWRDDAVVDGTTPDNIALASFELALSLLEDESIQDSAGTGSNVRRAKAGSAEVEFFVPTVGGSSETQFPQVVHELIAGFFSGSNTGLGAPFASGVDSSNLDESSHFDSDTDGYGVGGYA